MASWYKTNQTKEKSHTLCKHIVITIYFTFYIFYMVHTLILIFLLRDGSVNLASEKNKDNYHIICLYTGTYDVNIYMYIIRFKGIKLFWSGKSWKLKTTWRFHLLYTLLQFTCICIHNIRILTYLKEFHFISIPGPKKHPVYLTRFKSQLFFWEWF